MHMPSACTVGHRLASGAWERQYKACTLGTHQVRPAQDTARVRALVGGCSWCASATVSRTHHGMVACSSGVSICAPRRLHLRWSCLKWSLDLAHHVVPRSKMCASQPVSRSDYLISVIRMTISERRAQVCASDCGRSAASSWSQWRTFGPQTLCS
jgi:hypothetical protein